MRRIRKFCTRCMWVILYAIPVVLGLTYVAGYQAKKLAIRALNDKLNVRVEIQSVHISSIFTLPNVGIELVNLQVDESTDMFTGELARLGSVRVEFDLFEILRGNKEITNISVHNGKFQIYEDANGGNNYNIFKPAGNKNDESLTLDLKKIRIENCHIVYRNDDKEQFIRLRAYDLLASGALDEARSDLTLVGHGYIEQIMSANKNVVSGKNFDVDLDITSRRDIKSYQIRKGIIGLEKLYLNVAGDIMMIDDVPDLDITLEGRNVDITGLLSVLPYEQAKKIGEWSSSGTLKLKGYVKGAVSKTEYPAVFVDFGIRDGTLNHTGSQLKINSLSMEGQIKNSQEHKNDLSLELAVSRMQMDHSNLHGKVTVSGLNAPGLDIDVHGELGLQDINGFVPKEHLKKISGQVNVDMTGAIPWSEEYNDFDYAAVDMTGNIDCRNVQVLLPQMDIHALNFKGHVNRNEITDCQVSSKLDYNDVRFEGKLTNWVGYVFSNKRLAIEGTLASQCLDIDTMIGRFASHSSASRIPESDPEKVSIDLGVDADLDVAVQYFKWLEFEAEELNGSISFGKNRIWSDQLRIQCFEGRAELVGEVKTALDGFEVNAHCLTDKLNINQIFTQFNNFGQNELTNEHLWGMVSADVDIRFNTDDFFEVLPESVYVLTDIHVTKGRLKGYKPLESLSRFVELNELKDISFSDLENLIEIKNQTITIPHMDVKSSALNLEISGTHTFSNYMDYKIKISLTELLAARSGWIRKKREKKLEEGKDGGLNAFVIMRGTPDDLVIQYDKEAVKDKVKEEARRERKQFYSDLKKELRGERITTSENKTVHWDE